MVGTGTQRWVASVGAGREQVHSIRRAQKEGLRVVALDGDAAAPGLEIADRAYVVDLMDANECTSLIDRSNVDFIVPAPLGKALVTVGRINDSLGLPGIGEFAARASTDKGLFDRLVRKYGARRVEQLEIADASQVAPAAEKLGFPFVVKPRIGSGSRGVFVVAGEAQLPEVVAALTQESPLLLEEWVSGPEFGIDAVVFEGCATVVLQREKTISELPYRQVVSYSAPSYLSNDMVQEQIQLCVDAIGLEKCLLHADVIISSEGPVVIELAARPAGLGLLQHMIPTSSGLDFLGIGFSLLSPDPSIDLSRPPKVPAQASELRFILSGEGIVTRVPNVGALRQSPGVIHAEVWATVGDRLSPIRRASDVLARGVVVAKGWCAEDAARAVERALDCSGPIEVDGELGA